MLRLLPEVLDELERQHGIITPAALRRAGYSSTAIKKLVRHGVLELVLSGAYRIRGRPLDRWARWSAVCLAHPSLVIAGPSAAALWGLRRVPVQPRIAAAGELVELVQVLAPPAAQPTVARWVSVYRTAALHADVDVLRRTDGIRVTSRPRTAFDLARTVEGVDRLSIIEQVMHDGEHGVAEMRSVAIDWATPRRKWAREYLEAIDRLMPGSPAESHPEVELGDALRAAGVRGFERQVEIELPGYGSARFDLANRELRWAIEVDVFPTHRESEGRRRDARRDRAAHELGWTVTRLGPDAFGDALPATIERLRALAARLEPAVEPNR